MELETFKKILRTSSRLYVTYTPEIAEYVKTLPPDRYQIGITPGVVKVLKNGV